MFPWIYVAAALIAMATLLVVLKVRWPITFASGREAPLFFLGVADNQGFKAARWEWNGNLYLVVFTDKAKAENFATEFCQLEDELIPFSAVSIPGKNVKAMVEKTKVHRLFIDPVSATKPGVDWKSAAILASRVNNDEQPARIDLRRLD